MKKIFEIYFLVLFFLLSVCGLSLSEDSADHDLLIDADMSRGNNKGGIVWRVDIVSLENARTNSRAFEVQARGFDFLATAVSPQKRKGDKLLTVKGNMWFHKPGLSKPVSISSRQKLMGNAANGDIASTNYAEDYEIAKGEDGVVADEECRVFDLVASTKRATYDKIRYWISKERKVGVKAEYYTKSGKLFKSADMEYDNTVTLDNDEEALFVSSMVIKNALVENDLTTLTFSDPVLKKISDRIFNVNLLRR